MTTDLRPFWSAAVRRRLGIVIVPPLGMTPGQVGLAIAVQEHNEEYRMSTETTSAFVDRRAPGEQAPPPRAVGRIDQAIAELADAILGMAKLQAPALGGTAYTLAGDPTVVCIDLPLETVIVRITRE